jgi:hypothetical protein
MQSALDRFRKLAEQDLYAIVAEMQPKMVSVANAAISSREPYYMFIQRTILTKPPELRAKLAPVDAADIDSQDSGGCMENTRVRILQELADWSRDISAPRIFWLDGMAGTGKSAIARELSRRLHNDNLLGGSFFCSRRGVAEQADVKRILPTLCASLASREAGYALALLNVFGHNPLSTYSNLKQQTETLLERPFSSRGGESPSLVLVIDALDECADESLMRDLLERLLLIAGRLPLKFFLTSRPELHIRARLDSPHSASLRRILRLHDIEQDIVEKDISLYLTNRLRHIRDEWLDPLPDDWPAPSDVAKVSLHAGKLFIFAFTAVEYVRDDPVDRLRSLSGRVIEAGRPLTKRLDDIYTTVLLGALDPSKRESTERDLAKRILAAILTVRNPLTLSSLATLLYIPSRRLRSMLNHLHAVVYVPRGDDSGLLSTFHASFGDFLTDPERAPADMLLRLSKGHKDISAQCMALMSEQLCFNLSQCLTSYLPNSRQQLAHIPDALQYACLNFPYHVSASPESYIPSLIITLEDLLRKKFLFWVEALSAAGHVDKASNIISAVLTASKLVSVF